MSSKIEKLIHNEGSNYILPFFWQHGEDEATLRKYMEVIYNSNVRAVCVESRPHPDFCGPKWWTDLDIILDEARKRDMKVWILDDSHFPTGYANGALKSAPEELCRQNVFCHRKELPHQAGMVKVSMKNYQKPPKIKNMSLKPMMRFLITLGKAPRVFEDDRRISVVAVPVGEGVKEKNFIDLSAHIHKGVLEWDKPVGEWTVYIVGLSRNLGAHRTYINMLDKASCRMFIDAVYEPHYARYANDFGETIAGFFSDEPELGNGPLYPFGNVLGTYQDLPWSRELEAELKEAWGEQWRLKLPLLWENNYDNKMTAMIRYTYMDKLTELVKKDFSFQLGDWCRNHGVEYIGHVIEDNNQHARTGSSLGHYFRGLAGQDMAGIDDIGGQVLPQGEDEPTTGVLDMPRDGEFFHYVLGKLGASHGAIDPRKKGRTMCEIFGNYGWAEGVQLEKYLADHFLVRGVNHYVPHAFSPKSYPDSDCPPHFYANGNDPQIRHFGVLMQYMNRMCELISDGYHIAPAAILYHGEAEWAGNCMLMQKPARVLADAQVDYDFIPIDVFALPEEYGTELANGLKVNTQQYRMLVVPTAQYVPAVFVNAVAKLHAGGFPVVFLDRLPEGVSDGDDSLLTQIRNCTVLSLANLVGFVRTNGFADVSIEPANNRVRYLYYKNPKPVFLLSNEASERYEGTITLPETGSCYFYNAWENRIEPAQTQAIGGCTRVKVTLEPRKCQVLVFDEYDKNKMYVPIDSYDEKKELVNWKRSTCRSIDYPVFNDAKDIMLPDKLAEEKPKFSGFARYEISVELKRKQAVLLEISDASEGVELFVNGKNAGIQIVPPYRYDITGLVKTGTNKIAIEVATTLERERSKIDSIGAFILHQKAISSSGLHGTVNLLLQNRIS